MKVTKRIAYIDYSKGLGILLIMFAHTIQWFESMLLVNRYVHSFHVPIFFIAAGCLAYYQRERRYDFKTFCCKKAKTLLIPYVFFSLFNTALECGVYWITHSLTREMIRNELEALLITGNGTVWFLLTLFGVEVLFWVVKNTALAERPVAVGLWGG